MSVMSTLQKSMATQERNWALNNAFATWDDCAAEDFTPEVIMDGFAARLGAMGRVVHPMRINRINLADIVVECETPDGVKELFRMHVGEVPELPLGQIVDSERGNLPDGTIYWYVVENHMFKEDEISVLATALNSFYHKRA